MPVSRRSSALTALTAATYLLLSSAAAAGTQTAYDNPTTLFPFSVNAGVRLGDDLFLGNQCICDLSSFEFTVTGGGDGTGDGYTVTYGLYNACANGSGELIPGTAGTVMVAHDGDYRVTHVYDGSGLQISSPVWLSVEFSRNGCAWYMGEAPLVGFSADVFDFPTIPCESTLSGSPFYSSFNAKVVCEELAAPVVQSPSPPDGATGVATTSTVLRWNEFGQTAASMPDENPDDFVDSETFVDGTLHPDEYNSILEQAIANGEIEDPSLRLVNPPDFEPRTHYGGVAGLSVPTVTPSDIFIYEDSLDLIANGFTDGQLFNLMGQATNAVITQYGDNFDFVAFFINFIPDRQIGAAFYLALENDVGGIGLQSGTNSRPNWGVLGDNVEGWVMMWRESSWGVGSSFTYLVLGQEFEHRFAMFLNPLPGNRSLQGNNGSCGRSAHWNFRVDGQGSGMEIAEWVGSSPATRTGGTLQYNKDIPGGVFSYPDLYLMGYVSPDEMDANASELRYMDGSGGCSGTYSGNISTWGSADVIASNGARTPNSFFAQKHFNTAWVMIHRPGSLPTSQQVQRVVDILNNWNDTYITSTLQRGTMSNVLDPVVQPSACDTVYEVRLDENNPPTTLVCDNAIEPMCDPGNLGINTTYHWQVTGTKVDRSTTGPVWSFDTSCIVGASDPPNCAIDARQPHAPGDAGTRQTWDEITITYLCDTAGTISEDFTVSVEEGPAPIVTSVVSDGIEVTLTLSEPIPPGQWTCILHEPTGAEVCLGSLPGDVDGDRAATPADVLSVIDAINGIDARPVYQTDADRSGVAGPEDILRVIDLLNGAAAFEPWLDATLGACPLD